MLINWCCSLEAISLFEDDIVENNDCTVGYPSPRENYGQPGSISRICTTIYFELIAKFPLVDWTTPANVDIYFTQGRENFDFFLVVVVAPKI
jgi:hypothetical protein